MSRQVVIPANLISSTEKNNACLDNRQIIYNRDDTIEICMPKFLLLLLMLLTYLAYCSFGMDII